MFNWRYSGHGEMHRTCWIMGIAGGGGGVGHGHGDDTPCSSRKGGKVWGIDVWYMDMVTWNNEGNMMMEMGIDRGQLEK